MSFSMIHVLCVDLSVISFFVVLQAVVVVADGKTSLTVSGLGDVLSPHVGVIGVSHLMVGDCMSVSHRHAKCRNVDSSRIAHPLFRYESSSSSTCRKIDVRTSGEVGGSNAL